MADRLTEYMNQRMRQYETERARLVEAFVTGAWRMWRSLTPADWWNDAITQGAGANLTERYMAFVTEMRRRAVNYADLALGIYGATIQGQLPDFEVTRNDTDPWKIMLRPVETYRDESVKQPHLRPSAWDNLDEAARRAVDTWLEQARHRLDDIIDTDSAIIMRNTTVERYKANGVKRYRRIIHPELSRTGTCGLCIVAADRVYTIDTLMPLHARCHCTILPIINGQDPGRTLNDQDLQEIYRKAGGTTRDKLTNLRVLTATSSEIGPILTLNETRSRKPDQNWQQPDQTMTDMQIRRMLDRATVFDNRYRQVMQTGQPVTFRLDDHTYTFKPSTHLREALAMNLRLARQLSARLNLAA